MLNLKKKLSSATVSGYKKLRKCLRLKYFLWALLICVLVITLAFGYVVASTFNNPIIEKLKREQANTANKVVNDVTELNPVKVIDIIVPHTEEEIINAVKENDRVSIGGGRNSMGGQTASERAIQIDTREYNKIISLSTSTKEITVQPGIRWRDIQDHIDPHGLSVMIMQTYSNFTVGGSLSVNVHGRYIGQGPMILSIKQFRIVLADGSVVTASPQENAEIFYSAIGGMGGMGVVTEVTLSLADNINVERSRTKITTEEYADFFTNNVRSNPDVLFHNGDMYPPAFESISAVSWTKTDKEPTTEDRLIPRANDYWKERAAWVIMSEWPLGRSIREYLLDPYVYSGPTPVHTRNYEASYDVAELEPEDRDGSTYVLQEYFVPVERFNEWVPKMKKVFIDNDVNIINVSIRHALPDPGATLAWAKTESFAFVVYYKQDTTPEAIEHVGNWTRQMIDEVLTVGGTYYLPYQLHATDNQLHRAYPGMVDYFEIKKKYDPANKFTNKMWDKYYSEEKLEYYKQKRKETEVTNSIKDYYRNPNTTYLALPEWYIVYSAEEYATVLEQSLPSQFPYFGAIKDYWNQHEVVTTLTADTPINSDYRTVLSVIGWSFTLENVVKGLYENTAGKIFELLAGNTPVAEDLYAAKIARDYGTFLYDYPWYDFPFFSAFKGTWTLDNQTDHTLLQGVRRLERKLLLSLEYGAKSIYGGVIRVATHSKFGVQDDLVYAVISKDGGVTIETLSAPHYHPFTRQLTQTLEEEQGNEGFVLYSIAGNDKITLTYRAPVGTMLIEKTELVFKDTEISSFVDTTPQFVERFTVLVQVQDLPLIYKALKEQDVEIGHVYDY